MPYIHCIHKITTPTGLAEEVWSTKASISYTSYNVYTSIDDVRVSTENTLHGYLLRYPSITLSISEKNEGSDTHSFPRSLDNGTKEYTLRIKASSLFR